MEHSQLTSLLHPSTHKTSSASKSHRSIFSSISSRSSIHSANSTRSSTPAGCRDYRLRYAKDSQGHDLSSSYPYAQSAAMVSSDDAVPVFPIGARDSIRLRYAKDAKGHDFSTTYPAQFGVLDAEDEVALIAAAAVDGAKLPNGRNYKRVNRYHK